MPVATLAEVKGLLGIPLGDTSKDGALQIVLDATEAWALEKCGFTLTAITGRVDTVQNQRLGYPFFLPKRPVSAITTVEGRTLGDTVFQALKYDLVDAEKGQLIVLGSDFIGFYGQGYGAVPERLRPHPYYRWREAIWPIIKVTYNVAALTVPADFKQGVIAVAAAVWSNQSRGGLQSLTVGNITESYEKYAASSGALGHLMPYFRETVKVVL